MNAALFAAVRSGDVEAVRRLLSEGANPRLGDEHESPLHAAARRGPLELVEALIVGGAFEWQTDADGRTALDVARGGSPLERDAIIALLDRSAIADVSFRAAVEAIHAGDVSRLAALLDAEPRLLRERILGPEAYRVAVRDQYFRDPKLFWFVAGNPTVAGGLPANITEIAQTMIERGVDAADLDYTLGLTLTSSAARERGLQLPLVRVLLAAGASVTRDAILTTAAHCELGALRALVNAGLPEDALVAAALGDCYALAKALEVADAADVQAAFGLAAINGNLEAARMCLAAGADVDAPVPVHAHCTALHQAALLDSVEFVELLIAHGARTDIRDTLWDGTPLDWAIHENRPSARAALERAAGQVSLPE